ncbi:TIGR04255 family protein [Nonomuraea angiospora]|uniref:TIGR04255 family protein n=1 Tax=Nonomuraea angiospora TaxID=46172 RepID=UPI0033326E1F
MKLPEFTSPPVVEVAMDVQFRALLDLRGLRLAPLYETWREAYPKVEEQPPLVPAIEGAALPFQLNIGSVPIRYWFVSEQGNDLVQLQPDRLSVNWREITGAEQYPRYTYVREVFTRRLSDLSNFVMKEGLGALEIVQAELSYINAIELQGASQGALSGVLHAWRGFGSHHLGEPEQVRLGASFKVDGLGQPPVRMHVQVNPGENARGEAVQFLSLVVRGNPGGGTASDALAFFDKAHEHIVTSFTELTVDQLHEVWGRQP